MLQKVKNNIRQFLLKKLLLKDEFISHRGNFVSFIHIATFIETIKSIKHKKDEWQKLTVFFKPNQDESINIHEIIIGDYQEPKKTFN
jgi:hypothetical protein